MKNKVIILIIVGAIVGVSFVYGIYDYFYRVPTHPTCFTVYDGTVSYKKSLFGRIDVLDEDGDVVMQTNYTEVIRQYDGLYKVYYHNRVGIIDSSCNVILEAKYDDITVLKMGNVTNLIVNNNGYEIYNQQGDRLIDETYDHIDTTLLDTLMIAYVNGFVEDYDDDSIYNSIIAEQDGKVGVIDFNGKVIVPIIYDSLIGYSIEVDLLVAEIDGAYGLVTKDNQIVLPIEYKEIKSTFITDFHDKVGIISSTGEVKVEPMYDQIIKKYATTNTERMYFVQDGNQWGILNKNYNLILPVVYDNLKVVEEEDMIVVIANQNGLYGIIDFNQQILTPYLYDRIRLFSNISTDTHSNLYEVSINRNVGLIDVNNNIIVPIEYDHVFLDEGHIKLTKDNLSGVVDLDGNTIIEVSYQGIEILEGYILYRKEGVIGMIDWEGNILVPIESEYEKLELYNDYIIVYRDDKMGVIDYNNNILISCIYNDIKHKQDNVFLIRFLENDEYREKTVDFQK